MDASRAIRLLFSRVTDTAEIHDRLAALYREREKARARLAEIEREIAATWDELPEGPGAPGLRPSRGRGSVNSEHMLTAEHKTALSRSRKGRDEKFLTWIRDKKHGGWSLNRLAAAVPMSPASISQARLPTKDEHSRPIRQSKAERIRELTGWPADAWPGGVIAG